MIPDLIEVAPDRHLQVHAGLAYLRMLTAGCPPGITSAYRSAETQQTMRDTYLAAVARGEHPAYVAAVSGSGHPKGTRLDLPPAPAAWVKTHGRPYGWWWGENESEPWHMAFSPQLDTHMEESMTISAQLSRIAQIAEALDITVNGTGVVHTSAELIAERINPATRRDGSPHLIAVQGDIDQILTELAAIKKAITRLELR